MRELLEKLTLTSARGPFIKDYRIYFNKSQSSIFISKTRVICVLPDHWPQPMTMQPYPFTTETKMSSTTASQYFPRSCTTTHYAPHCLITTPTTSLAAHLCPPTTTRGSPLMLRRFIFPGPSLRLSRPPMPFHYDLLVFPKPFTTTLTSTSVIRLRTFHIPNAFRFVSKHPWHSSVIFHVRHDHPCIGTGTTNWFLCPAR